jgi:two-component system response regulator DesR
MIRVLLAEDQTLLRKTLAELLSRDPELEIVAECDHGDQVLPLARVNVPHVAVLDIDMPGVDGLTTCQRLSVDLPDVRVLMLTVLARPGYLKRALDSGAIGFLLKDTPPDALAEAIKLTARGERVVDSALAVEALSSGASPLTTRETELLRLALTVESTADLAGKLQLSQGTVRNIVSSAMRKLDARSRGQAARTARDKGWI